MAKLNSTFSCPTDQDPITLYAIRYGEDFAGARTACAKMNGQLAVVRTQREGENLKCVIDKSISKPTPPYASGWIGELIKIN